MSRLSLELPESISEQEARFELAKSLFQSGRLTQGEAATMAGLSRPTFIELLGKSSVSFTNIDEEDLEMEFREWRESVFPIVPR